MTFPADPSRRRVLKQAGLGLVLLPAAGSLLRDVLAANLPLVTPDDPTAQAVRYVADANKAAGAKPGSHCGSCMLYQGAAGSAQGGCALFPGKSVKATGWCTSWAPKS